MMLTENERDFKKRGAEAKLYFLDLFGKKVVKKVRDKKKYRQSKLDEYLRKTRNRTEARCILHANRSNVNSPRIYHVGTYELILERLDGRLMKEKKLRSMHYRKVGELLAQLHSIGITHGDFTPANVMFVDDEPYLIDFGLSEFSKDAEERAVDLLLMKRSIGKNFKYFIKGYSKLPQWREIIEQMRDIEKRGRYQKRQES